MRVVQNPQMQIGEVDISQIKFDPKSRDDIPRILRGLGAFKQTALKFHRYCRGFEGPRFQYVENIQFGHWVPRKMNSTHAHSPS